jgi:hypothetical protein
MVKLASALDVPPDQLLEGISWMPGEIGEAKPGKFQHNPNPNHAKQANQPPNQEEARPRTQAKVQRSCKRSQMQLLQPQPQLHDTLRTGFPCPTSRGVH